VLLKQEELISEIYRIKKEYKVTIVAHFYQKDDVFALADFSGDSLQLAKIAMEDKNPNLVFCGVGFMGESVKILSPNKRVIMPKLACCAMARMIDGEHYDNSIALLEKQGIKKDDILPITYINSSAAVKAKVGMMGGLVCTSSNAKKIIDKGLKSGKKILFVPDKCLGQNIARINNLSSCVIGDGSDPKDVDIICYNGFCSVHQLFSVDDIEFYRARYPDIKIVTHPECQPEVCINSDFVGSTSQIIEYIKGLDEDQKVAVGTEFNLVNRLRDKNTYILSGTKPECPTMNETVVEDLYDSLKSIEDGSYKNEIVLDEEVAKWARTALQRMFEV
jgi:quinolinate synthase